ncbi:bifunctional diguanylate cyclase/phosphodiesterase [Phycicoccus flavus]|uniref:EAL domain-containing protein n=1 Tax=Phycicoccus flavus TaxID=2502783 RepID=A0A8T6R6U5_9MICO|nr:EAL domain-containing protein [Phycicoccus flavus]NHA67961.1 EAL domain-containing protein [Phycicoccus flavus]
MSTRTLSFAAVFALALAVGRATALPDTGLALFWPAAGVAALWGLHALSRLELGLAAGLAAVLAAVANALTGVPTTAALAYGSANAVLVLGVRGVMSWDGRLRTLGTARPTLSRVSDVYRFLAAAGGTTLVSAALGMPGLATTGAPVTWQSASVWLVRNLAAVVVVAAPGLALRDATALLTRRAALRALPHLLATLAVLWLVFGPGRTLPLGFVPFALVIWSGLRLPLPFAVAQGGVVAVGTLALVTGYGGGPFGAIDDPRVLAVTLQAYMLLAVGLAVVVATVQRERDALVGDLAAAARHARHQAEDLRVITETIPDGIVVVDRSGEVLLHNDAARQWLDDAGAGLRVAARSADDVEEADDGGEDRPVVRALAGETVRGAVLEVPGTGRGATRVLAVDAVPMADGGEGPPDRALVVLHDVSDEQARLRALEAERERTARLISDAPHGVAVLDMSGHILEVNDALATLAGRRVEDLVGLSFDELAPAHRDRIAVYLERAVAVPGELLVGDWTIESPSGEDAHVSLTSRVLVADGDDDVILVNVVDFSERRRYEEKLTYLADHDALTGLPNRRRFDEVLDRHLQRCRRGGPTGALLLLDLDNFKEVNDTMGHDAGDRLIVAVGALVRDTLRDSDLVARLGGDEFAVLLPDADAAGAEAVAAALVARVRAHCATLEGVNRRVTASVGVATFAAAAQQSVDPLALADMLLYDAKDAGRNRHAVLDPGGTQQPRTGARLEWTARVEAALENDSFALYLQPILDVRTDRVVAAEALLRLVDRDEPVSPARFVHVAERAGLAPRLDRWVVRNAVALLSRLHEHAPDLTLEVNLSAHSIGDESVEREFLAALDRHAVPAHRIVVEATETAAVADVAAARAFSQRLAALGTRVAIDDFGAGFGSFYYLKHLPFDIVKIDGEFVAGAHRSAVDRAILRSIVGVARGLGKETVAEFVAEEAVLAVVRELGVDYAQGYLVGEPVPAAEFVARYCPGGSAAWTTEGPAPRGAADLATARGG